MAIVKVDIDDLQNNPQCVHGPTLKFSRKVGGQITDFFACSAYRDRKDCPFYLLENDIFTDEKKSRWYELKRELIDKYNHYSLYGNFLNISKLHVKERHFCRECNMLFSSDKLNDHSKHDLYTGAISDEMLKFPTKILSPLQSDKKEAQYWFTENSIKTLLLFLGRLEVKGALCVGSPTIHEHCRWNNIKSILLDIDPRYHNFYSTKEFIWFNMFNYHFMNNNIKDSSSAIKEILNGGLTAVIIDPPFGARYEGLAYTMKQLVELNAPENPQIIFLLVLPYFMEPQVKNMDLNLKKLDFSIEYINHRFKKNKTPVRLFTNANQSLFPVDNDGKSKFCSKCEKVCPTDSDHCRKCDSCHALNFKTCDICCKCVKPSYYHCKKCRICVNQNHVCSCKRLLSMNVNKKKKKKIK